MLLNVSALQHAGMPAVKNQENAREKFSNQRNDFSQSCLIGHREAQALRAKALFFGGITNAPSAPVIDTTTDPHHIIVNNVFALKEKDVISKEFIVKVSNGGKTVQVLNSKTSQVILTAVNKNMPKTGFPVLKFVTGKGGDVAIIDTGKIAIHLMEGSEFKNNKLEVSMPRLQSSKATGSGSAISFCGKIHPGSITDQYHLSQMTSITAINPEKSATAIHAFMSKHAPKVEPEPGAENNYKDFYPVITVGGFGSRIGPLLYAGNDNKPSLPTPGGCSLIHYTLLQLVRAGLINKDTITNEFREKYEQVGTAGGTILAIRDGKIPANKNIIICSSDAVSDFSYAKALNAFRGKEDAGLMVLGTPVAEEDVKKFGVIGKDADMRITSFVEKPDIEKIKNEITELTASGNDPAKLKQLEKTLQGAESAKITEGEAKGKYLANIAVYVMSPEVIKRLNQMYTAKEKQYKKDNPQDQNPITPFDFGKDALPQLLDECRKGKITRNGAPLRMYSYVADDGDWADVGNIPDFMKESRAIADGKRFKNLPPFILDNYKDNVDPETGVIYCSQTKHEFKEFLGDGTANGNIIVLRKRG